MTLKYLKRGWNRKEGRGNKDFIKGGQTGSNGECLEKRRAGTLLRTMAWYYFSVFEESGTL